MKAQKGNVEKANSYALAMTRINTAIEHRFPLEAIAIEESILSDRLRAYAEHVAHPFERPNTPNSFSELLEAFKQELQKRELFKNEYKQLYDTLNKWRKARNKILHGIVKTNKSGEAPIVASGEFFKEANKIAEQGKANLSAIQIIRRKELSSKVR